MQILEVRFWHIKKIVMGRSRQHACGSVHVRRGYAIRNGLKGGRRAFSAASRSALAFAACAGAE